MARMTLICIISKIRDIYCKVSNLSSKSKQQDAAKASISLAAEIAKSFDCSTDCSTSKLIDALDAAEKKVKSIRSKSDADAIVGIVEEIERLKAISLNANFEQPEIEAEADEAEADEAVDEAVEAVEAADESVEAVETVDEAVEAVEAETDVVPMNRDEVLRESHKLAKKIRSVHTDLTYSQALKIATAKMYARMPKTEKSTSSTSRKSSTNQSGKDALQKAHAMAKQLRESNPGMTYQQALKQACNTVYGH